MRTSIAVVLLLVAAGAGAQTAITPEGHMALGTAAYRNRDFVSAVTDLTAAVDGFLAPESTEPFVATGQFERLAPLETSLVYLALAQFRVGEEDESRQTVLRLQSAERIAPTFAVLPLGTDAADIESLAAALVGEGALPHNTGAGFPEEDETGALPPVSRRAESLSGPEDVRAARRDIVAALTGGLIASAATAFVEPSGGETPPDTRPDVNSAERVATADATTAAPDTPAVTEPTTPVELTAPAPATAETEVRTAPMTPVEMSEPAPVEVETEVRTEPMAPPQTSSSADSRVITTPSELTESSAPTRVSESEALTQLRAAESAADRGDLEEAIHLYTQLATDSRASREVIGESAAGLYRTGAFHEAAEAFQRFGTFARGEEDLRYYYAVSLYETGAYAEAARELACALPFLEVTDDVARSRAKIENTIAAASSR